MAAPSKVDEFLDLVRKSGVVDDKRLAAYLQKPLPDDLGKLAGVLVRDGILTHFQAEQFLLGKWRRFTIGKYKVLERLGSGGMGSVYLCEHKFMRRRVAVKVLPAAKAEEPASLERFYREARAVAALDHPNIVRAYDIDQDEKLHFLVMEYVDGASLQELIKKHGPMDITRTAHYIQQAAVGLQHAFQVAGLIHRDIKPGNVLVDRNGVVKVLDMGLARFFHDEDDQLTKKHDENVLGTADYLAPEQALDSHSVDIRADIYSLGATFYFILTGNTPFTEGTVAQKLIWHQTRQPKPVRSVRPEVPEKLVAVLEKMMAKDPGQRYQTPADVVTALGPWTQQPIPPPPESEMPRLSPAAMGTGDTGLALSAPTAPMIPAPSSRPQPTPAPQRPPAAATRPAAAAATLATPPPATVPRPTAPDNGFATDIQAKVEEPPNWELLTPDSGVLKTTSSSSRVAALAASPWLRTFRENRWFWIIVGASAALLFFLLVIVWAFSGKSEKSSTRGSGNEATLYVAKSGQAGAYRTVREAIAAARPGDRIVIQDETIEEQLLLEDGTKRGTEVTIEGGVAGKNVVWTCPERFKDGKFVQLDRVEGLKLKKITFDGQNRNLHVVTMMSQCAGVALEDVTLTGFTRAAISLWNCTGRSAEKVSLTRVRLKNAAPDKAGPEKHAIVFNANPLVPNPNQFIAFNDCLFEGPYKAAVFIDGTVDNVEFRRCRFFDAVDAVHVKAKVPRFPVRMTFESNTFCDIKRNALYLDNVPDFKQNNLVTLKNNLFCRTTTLAELYNHLPKKLTQATPAHWIWTNEGDPIKSAPPGTRHFRHTFVAPKSPVTRAVLDIASDEDCTVWLNGIQIGKGNGQRVKTFDVSADLKPDKNVLAVVCVNKGGPAGLLVQLSYTPTGQDPIVIVSNKAWKSHQGAEPPNWRGLDFDDKAWPAVKEMAVHAGTPWKDLPWESVVQQQLRDEGFKNYFSVANNIRDRASNEGNLLLGSTLVDFPPLPSDPKKDDFLLYPKNGPLDKLAEKPGVPPE